jgi:hypothetical protein
LAHVSPKPTFREQCGMFDLIKSWRCKLSAVQIGAMELTGGQSGHN